jgi:hypothetical protein
MRIAEIIEINTNKLQLDENMMVDGLAWLKKSLPFIKDAGKAAGEKAVDASKYLAGKGVELGKGAGTAALANPGKATALGAGGVGVYHLNDIMISAKEKFGAAGDQIAKSAEEAAGLLTDIFTSLRVPFNDPTVQQYAKYAVQYGLPIGIIALFALGGKKIYDYLTSGNSAEKTAEGLLESIFQERGATSRAICLSKRSDASLGASALSSCKSQGLRARDGNKSHKIGKKRVKMSGQKIKGKSHGGPLPDWS